MFFGESGPDRISPKVEALPKRGCKATGKALGVFFFLFESSRRLPVLQTLRGVRGGQTVANNVLPILVLFSVRFKCASVETCWR